MCLVDNCCSIWESKVSELCRNMRRRCVDDYIAKRRRPTSMHQEFLVFTSSNLLASDELYSDIVPPRCKCRGCKRTPPPPSLAPSVALTRTAHLTVSTCSLVGCVITLWGSVVVGQDFGELCGVNVIDGSVFLMNIYLHVCL